MVSNTITKNPALAWVRVKRVWNWKAKRYLLASDYGRDCWLIPIRRRKG